MAKDESPTGGTHETALPSRAEEARNLVKEAREEISHGNKEEGDFLLAEAKNLDPEAVKDLGKSKQG